jgi:hypothetical protein
MLVHIEDRKRFKQLYEFQRNASDSKPGRQSSRAERPLQKTTTVQLAN